MQAEIRKRKGNRIMDEEIRKARSRQYGSFYIVLTEIACVLAERPIWSASMKAVF